MGQKKINCKVKYRDIKYPRLEFKSGKLELILPYEESPEDLIEKHKNWITKKQKFIEKCLEISKSKNLVRRNNKQFRKIVDGFTSEIAKDLNVNVNRVFFRKMRTKWASCSPKKNLTINTMMRYLPERLIEYIIYHELTHLIEKRHNERFWEIIENRFEDFKNLEMSLFPFWFLINSLNSNKKSK